MRFFTLAVACLGLTEAFSPTFVRKSSPWSQQSGSESRRSDIVVRHVAPEIVLPIAVFLAAAAATVTRANQDDDPIEVTYSAPVVEEAPVAVIPKRVAKKAKPAPAPVAKKVTPAPAPKPAPVAVPKPAPVFATSPVPAPPAPVPVPAPKKKDISQLKLEIASSLEQEQEKVNQLLADARRDVKEAADRAAKATSENADDVVEAVDETYFEEEELAPAKGGKRKLVVRVIKKVIAPWRKWSNIQ